VKSHYELLGLDTTSDVETIKKAFRREIARYHPDKVTHLGHEFQEIASARAAELTSAYTTLTNPAMRAEYDAKIAAATSAVSSPPPDPVAPPPSAPAGGAEGATGAQRFERERAGRDDIVRRAAISRVQNMLKHAMTDCDLVSVKGFDVACLPRSRSSLFRRTSPPSVLVRVAATVDRALVTEAWTSALKARVEQQPVVLLLVGNALAPTGELAQVIEEIRRKNPEMAERVFPVPVDIRDWSAKIPGNAPAAIRTLIQTLKNYAG
jgi:curved DNA-binding protein CbpA